MIFQKKSFNLKTMAMKLTTQHDLCWSCSKLHCQKVFQWKFFFFKIWHTLPIAMDSNSDSSRISGGPAGALQI